MLLGVVSNNLGTASPLLSRRKRDMEEDFWFRILYDDLHREKRLSSYDVLWKWHPQAVVALNKLATYGQENAIGWKVQSRSSEGHAGNLIPPEVSWRLYAVP